MVERASALLEHWLPPALVASTALAFAPHLASPFTSPKEALLVAGALLSLGIAAARARSGPTGAHLCALAWLGALGFAALGGRYARLEVVVLQAAAGVLLLALPRITFDVLTVARSAAAAGAAVAAVAVLQAVGADPLRLVGFAPAIPGARMRIYSTLGNPDVVAAWLSAALCLSLGGWRARSAAARVALAAAAATMVIGLMVTRSLATGPSLLVGAATALACRRAGRGVAALFAAGALLLAASAWSRSPARALAGRVHLWTTAAAHFLDAPLTGTGPGGYALLQPLWEAERAAREGAPAERTWYSAQEHVHSDPLERAVEQGLPGALSLVAIVALALARAARAGRAAPAAAVATLSSRCLVDFPLARPAELTLFAVAVALCWGTPGTSGSGPVAPTNRPERRQQRQRRNAPRHATAPLARPDR